VQENRKKALLYGAGRSFWSLQPQRQWRQVQMLMGTEWMGQGRPLWCPWLCGCRDMLGAGLWEEVSALPGQVLAGAWWTRRILLMFLSSACCELF